MVKSYIKAKSGPNQSGPGFRTSKSFRSENFGQGSKFSSSKASQAQAKFNPAQFKTQHKG